MFPLIREFPEKKGSSFLLIRQNVPKYILSFIVSLCKTVRAGG